MGSSSNADKLKCIFKKSSRTEALIEAACSKLNAVIDTTNRNTLTLMDHDRRLLKVTDSVETINASVLKLNSAVKYDERLN